MWEIKGKDNQTKATPSTKPEYNGEWMGESYVTVSVESPTPIDFAIGDYLIYRDERFEINYDPGKIKSAPQYAKGDAFKYENIKFNSLADELTRCDFRDVVLQDNNLHFTSLPKFTFFGGVQDLANRIQANLDKLYTGANKWSVVVSPEFQGGKELNVSVDNIKVQGALEILVNQFETYYTIKGRTITIGAAGIPAGHLFKYGKGNGLYEIEQNAEADQAIVTRLRAYGSTRNLPHRYYNSLTGADGQKLIPDNMAVQHLMLPSFPYTTQDPYIDSANKATLGIRENTIFFDGSQEGLEEIYPSIEGMTAEQLKAAGVPCNSTGALDVLVSAEQMTDDGVGDINEGETETTATPPTFKVTLKDLGFDINDHLTTETATISFKTGMLGGREFEIVGCEAIKDSTDKVTGYKLELNRVYDDGIKLWFPYKDYNAKPGDKFVLLHIEMLEVYIKAAAQRLLEAANAWLAKNDYSRSVYAPKIDEIFMARQHDEAMASGGTIASLHDTLKEGMLLLFEDEDLNIDASIFIDRLSIKEGDGDVPTYEVVLKEEKTVGRLDKMQNQIDSLAAGGGQGGGYSASQIRSLVEAYGSSRFLSKVKDDRSKGRIASDLGFEVGKYLAGASGGMFGIDSESGESFADVFRLFVRGKAYFETLTIIEAKSLAGKQYITPGGSIKCARVAQKGLIEVTLQRPVTDEEGNPVIDDNGKPVMEEYTEMVDNGVPEGVYRCYFLSEQDGEKTETKIVAGDQVISEMFNAKTGTVNKVSNHRYWRLVTAVNNDAYTDESGNHYGYIELSATDCENGSDIPQEGDVIDQFGNRTDPARQAAMVFDTVGPDAPSIKMYGGINSYTLNDRAIISFGRDPLNNKVYFRLGLPGASQYLDYKQGDGLTLAGKLSVNSTIDGKTLNDYFTDLIPELSQDDIEGFVNAIVDPKLEGIQNQIDGVIETWFYNGVPTLSNYPASGWNTPDLKIQHLGDLYYDNDTGTAYRFSQNAQGGYYWNTITDDAITKALAAAKAAQDTADGKRRVFTSQPTLPYDKGDLWVNATYPAGNTKRDPANGKYYNDILRCGTARATGSFAIGDWGLSSNYTDDTLAQAAKDAADAAQNAADAAQSSVDNLNTYVDGAFKDDIITAAEASGIANYINTVNTDKERIAATYATLSNNAYLPASAKAPLKSAYDAVMSAINALISAINSAIADNKITPAEATAVNNAFATFNTANGSFSTAVENADKAIQDVLKNAADAAKTAADNAQAAADAAKGIADAAKDRLDNWAADGVISPTEKQSIRDEMVRIAADKAHIDSEFARYGLTDNEIHTAYKGCYNTYLGQLQALASTAQENNTIPSDFEDNQTTYYYARTLSLTLIAAEAKKYAEEVAKQEAQNAVAGYEYLKNALPQDTQIIGGLLMSTLISLGYTDAGNVRHTMAGINGAWVDALGGRTIGSWWGGPMVDLFDANDTKKNLAAGTYATSMVRMNGSAYFAGGNIGFRADGSGWLGNDLTGIKFDANGGMTFGSGVTFNVANVSGLKTTLDSLANFNLGLNRLLSPCNANDEEIPWEEAFQHDGSSDPNAIKAKSLKAKVDFWSTGGVTALGKSAGGSGGSGGSGGGSFGLMKVWPTTDPGSGTTDALGANLGWELRQDVLSLKSGSALSVVTAGSGNAITDIVKSGTTVTATKGATFLTQHQPLDYLNIKDVRDAVRPPTYFDAFRMSAWFNATGMPTSAWYSGIHMKGWSDGYASWQLAANSTNNTNDKNLYFRVGINATWESWQKVLTDANYSSVLNGKYVTLDTVQTITADKTFNAAINIITNNAILFPDATTKRVRTSGSAIHGGGDGAAETDANLRFGSWYGVGWYNTCIAGQSSSFAQGDNAMWLNVRNGHLYVQGGYHVKDGTSSQFLKADGSVDSNSYALASALGSYYTKAESDGKYVTALGTSGNYLTWTKNGVVNNVVVPWANNSDKLNGVAVQRFVYGDNNTATTDLVGAITDTIRKSGFYRANNDPTCPLVIHTSHSTNTYAFQLGTGYYDTTSLYFRHLSNNVWEAWRMVLDTKNYTGTLDTRYVKKAGDTMTGALTVPRINIPGTVSSTAYLTADAGHNAYFNIGGRNILVLNNVEASVRPGLSYSNIFSLGTSAGRWANVYATTINVTSTALVSNLNADMVDGKHYSQIASGGRAWFVFAGTAAPRWVRIAKSGGVEGVATYYSYGIISITNAYYNNTTQGLTLAVHMGYRIGSTNHIAQLGGHGGQLWKKARIVYPTASSSPYYLEVYMDTSSVSEPVYIEMTGSFNMELLGSYTEGSVPSGYATKELDLTTGLSAEAIKATTFMGALSGNATSATKLATARTINGTSFDGTANIVTSYWGATRTLWGQSCNGSANVSGNMTGVGNINSYGSSYGNYQITYGLKSGEAMRIEPTSTNGTWLKNCITMGVNGNVKVGGTGTTDYTLDVSGQIRANVATGTAPFVTPSTTLCTNLNADLLDGLHLSDIRSVGYAMQDTIIDASSLNVNTWYPVVINIGSRNNTRIEVIVALDSGTKPSWSTHSTAGFSVRVIWEVNGSGWGSNPVNRTIYASDYTFAEVSPVRGLGQLSNSSNEYVFVRGGGKYRFRTSNGATNISLKTSTFTVSNQSVSPTTTAPAEIIRDNARITDNVASATKLQTARTIWGQTFNGTANVSGVLTGVTDIIASGDIKAKRLSLNNGASYIEWDAANNAYKVNGNFYATGGSSCLGFNYLSATEVSVGTLNADIVKGNTLAIGGYGLIMASDDALAFIHGGGGSIAFGSTIRAYEGIILGDGSYTIDEVGVASLSDVSVLRLTINNAEFTVSGNEIYVTIGSTRYKLTKTTA